MEQDLAAAPATAQENPAAAAAAPIKIPVACPTTAVATMIVQPLAPVAVGLTPTKITDTATKPAATMEVTRPRKASRSVIALTMTMNRDLHVEEPAY
jgi:hypothetical protein